MKINGQNEELNPNYYIQQCTLKNYENNFRDQHILCGVISKWAMKQPDQTAIINLATNENITWADFKDLTTKIALQILQRGFNKGDCLITFLPFSTAHILLEYACFQIGVIPVPLDLRLPIKEVVNIVDDLKCGFIALLDDVSTDFLNILEECKTLKGTIKVPYKDNLSNIKLKLQLSDLKYNLSLNKRKSPFSPLVIDKYLKIRNSINENDPALIIYTTGSTGYPKPAVLSHRNITCHNFCLGTVFRLGVNTRTLVNLPPSHVGGQVAQLMTTLFVGGKCVILPEFDPELSLKAIEDYKINVLGQIPALYTMEWQLPQYSDYDLSSLDLAVYSGHSVDSDFLKNISNMAPRFGTGLSLTEAACFCTYHVNQEKSRDPSNLGFPMPLYPLSIRKELQKDGYAGEELEMGKKGHICFKGPQTFQGYLNMPEKTLTAISLDGYIYTGDIGYYDSTSGLHYISRAKWIIKPKGYNVFPGQVENHLSNHEKVSLSAVIGIEHPLYSEAILAFVEKKEGVNINKEELIKYSEDLPTYMHPYDFIILEPRSMPLNRTGKIDYLQLNNYFKNIE